MSLTIFQCDVILNGRDFKIEISCRLANEIRDSREYEKKTIRGYDLMHSFDNTLESHSKTAVIFFQALRMLNKKTTPEFLMEVNESSTSETVWNENSFDLLVEGNGRLIIA